jgi:hypothetical protein
MKLALPFLAFLALSGLAGSTPDGTPPPRALPWLDAYPTPVWQGRGLVRSVDIRLHSVGNVARSCENRTVGAPSAWDFGLLASRADFHLNDPTLGADSLFASSVLSYTAEHQDLAAFDGAVDFDGPSGEVVRSDGENFVHLRREFRTLEAQLMATELFSHPNTLSAHAYALGGTVSFTGQGSGALDFGADVELEITFNEPAP